MIDLLYISYVDLDGGEASGSGVRPVKMKEAFEDEGISLKILDGWPKNKAKRRADIEALSQWLDNDRASYCYVEPPSGPLFLREDRKLIRKIHDKGIPIGLFYRDIYWRYPRQFYKGQAVKGWVIRKMAERDLRLFQKTVDHLFFPSETMARIADFGIPWSALPPGAILQSSEAAYQKDIDRLSEIGPLTLLYVGGIKGDSGLDLLLEALNRVNQEKVKFRLLLCCRKEEWMEFTKINSVSEPNWLQVHHASGKALKPLYDQADLTIVPRKKTEYMDFSMPVKLFESVGFLKPVIVTNCKSMADFVERFEIGWVSRDQADDMAGLLGRLFGDRKDILSKKKALPSCLEANSWELRARTVIEEMKGIHVQRR